MQPGGKVYACPPGKVARGFYLTKNRRDGVSPNFDKLRFSYAFCGDVLCN